MIKFIAEFCPLLAFFYGYKTGGIMDATKFMVIASIISIAITYAIDKTVNKVNLISTALLLVSGSLTIFSGNSMFIKMKPTILYILFSLTFLITKYKGKPATKFILGASFKFEDEDAWLKLNDRFMVFFLLMAISNEFIWRSFTEETWVNFKVFAILPLTLAFTLSQIPFIIKNSAK